MMGRALVGSPFVIGAQDRGKPGKAGVYMKYLIVVDMQKDFIDGALGTKEAQALPETRITKIIFPHRREGISR